MAPKKTTKTDEAETVTEKSESAIKKSVRAKINKSVSKMTALVEETIEDIKNPYERKKERPITQVVSTGSTLLDLAICGSRIRGGGVPGGMIAEIFGPESSGKSALLSELAGSAQRNGGEARFDDPEARLDQAYAKIYGYEIDKTNYHRPDTVKEMFSGLLKWKPKDETVINVSCADSLAAFSTEMEMGVDGDGEDKMGMKRAKDFSEGLRKTARKISKNNWLVACSNQERESQGKITTPGGRAVPYYSSLRMRISPLYPSSKIKKTITVHGTKVEKVVGVRSKVYIVKSSIDEPYREAIISIIFGYGIDDVRENLIYLKNHTDATHFPCPDGEEFATIAKAISHIEDNDLEDALKERVIDVWESIEALFVTPRKRKQR